jgi:hypothetical protein
MDARGGFAGPWYEKTCAARVLSFLSYFYRSGGEFMMLCVFFLTGTSVHTSLGLTVQRSRLSSNIGKLIFSYIVIALLVIPQR